MIIDITTMTDGKTPILFMCNGNDIKEGGYAVFFNLDANIPFEEHEKILKRFLEHTTAEECKSLNKSNNASDSVCMRNQ